METEKMKRDNGQSKSTFPQNLPGMIYRRAHDQSYTLLYAGDGCRALTGFEPEELVGNETIAYGDLIHPDDQASTAHKIGHALASRDPFHCLYRLMTGTGREKWVLDNGQGVYDDAGNLVAIEGVVVNNTERVLAFHQMEKRLLERSRKLAALHDILSVATTSGELRTAMRRALRRAVAAAGGDAGFVHLADDEGTTLHLLTHEGLPSAAATALHHVVAGDNAIGWVATQRRPLLLRQRDDDPRLASLLTPGYGAGAFLGAPIPAGRRICGVLTVLSRDETRFGNEEAELLAAVGEQLGVIVENMRLRRQAEQLLVMEERNRLARELHDSVTQALYSVTLFAEAGYRHLQTGHVEQAGAHVGDVIEISRQALKEMRLLLHKLRPLALEEEGLARALQRRLDAVEGRAGVRSKLTVDGELNLSPSVEEALYHISQEALNNALKHAGAGEVTIRVRCGNDGLVEMWIRDDGRGFDVQDVAGGPGIGLTSMRERAERLGGTISYDSAPGQGTTIYVKVREGSETGNARNEYV